MAEDTEANENTTPTVKTLNARITMLEQQLSTGKEKVESYTREQPLMVLGLAFLIGVGLGTLLAKGSKD